MSDSAKLLYCHLQVAIPTMEFAYAALREMSGLSQNSLLRALDELVEEEWVMRSRLTRWSVRILLAPHKRVAGFTLSSELISVQDLPWSAKGLWAILRQQPTPPTYSRLRLLTGWCDGTIIKAARSLREKGWVIPEGGTQSRSLLQVIAVNPNEIRRRTDLDELQAGLDRAHREGYSRGQYLLFQIVRLHLPNAIIKQNVEVKGLAQHWRE